MTTILAVAVVLMTVHIGLNIFITRRVLVHGDYDAFQKKAQIGMVWLLPIAGLIAVWWFARPRLQRRRTEEEYADEDVQESIHADP